MVGRPKTWCRPQRSSGLHGVDGGSSEPVLEADLAQPGVGAGHERTLAKLRAEVARVRVGDDYPSILACTETESNAFVKAKLLWPRHFNDAVQRCSHCDPANRNRNIRGRYGLEQHGGDVHRIPVGGIVGDAFEELEELRSADDRVRDRRVSDQLVLGDLRAEV